MKKKRFVLMVGVVGCLVACHAPEQQTTQTASVVDLPVASVSQSEPIKTVQFHGTDVRRDELGGDFILTDGSGQDFLLSSLQGRAVLLIFGYTHCPDICPTELLIANDAMKQLGDLAKQVAVVFVSVDSERDTPAVVGEYVKQFNQEFIGLTATAKQDLPIIKQQYRVVSAKVQPPDDRKNYVVDHSTGMYVLDKQGNVVVLENYGTDASQIADDLKQVLQL